MPPLTELAVALLSGALTGYITNHIAVSMLFKKFCGRWGGVIETHYEDFVVNMSDLVESDLLNQDTLRKACGKEEFRAAVHHIAADIIETRLPALSGHIALKDIPGMDRSVSNMLARVKEREGECMRDIYMRARGVELRRLVSAAQYRHVVTRAAARLEAESDRAGRELDAILRSCAAAAGGLRDADETDRLLRRAADMAKDAPIRLPEPELRAFWSAFTRSAPFLAALESLETRLGETPLGRFDAPARSALRTAADMAEEADGAARLWELLKSAADGIPLREITGAAGRESLARFAETEVRGIVEETAAAVRENAAEIEALVNEALDEQLGASRWGGMLRAVKELLPDGNIARRYGVASEIEEALSDYAGEAARGAGGAVRAYIDANAAGDIPALLEKNGMPGAEGAARLAARFLRKAAMRKTLFGDGAPAEMRLKDVYAPRLSAIPEDVYIFLYNMILCAVSDEGAGSHGGKTYTLKKSVQTRFLDGAARARFAPPGGAAVFDMPRSENFFRGGGAALAGRLLAAEETALDVKPLALFEGSGGPGPSALARTLWEKRRTRPLGGIYRILRRAGAGAKSAGALLDLIHNNMEYITAGNVSRLVRGELGKRTPAQINALVRDFMGRELRPINLFGGFLGGIAGVLSAVLVSGLDVRPGLSPALLSAALVAAYCLLFAAVGVGTNALAIRMLFRPYKKIIFNTPPFVGVVARGKSRFAESVGAFVRDGVLSYEALSAAFNEGASGVRQKIARALKKDGYRVFGRVLGDRARQAALCGSAARNAKTYILSRQTEAAAFLAALPQKAAGADFSSLLARYAPPPEKAASALAPYIHKKARETDAARLVAACFTRAPFIPRSIYTNAIHALTGEKAAPLARAFAARLGNRPLAGLAPPGTLDRAVTAGGGLLARAVTAAARKNAPRIAEALRAALPAPDVTAREAAGGAAARLEEGLKNRLFERVGAALYKNRHRISERILSRLNFAARLALGAQIEGVVERVIREKLPVFLRRNEARLTAVVTKPLDAPLSAAGYGGILSRLDEAAACAAAALDGAAARAALEAFCAAYLRRLSALPLDSLPAAAGFHAAPDAEGAPSAGAFLPALLDGMRGAALDGRAADAALAVFAAALPQAFAGKRLSALVEGPDAEALLARFFDILKNDTQAAERIRQSAAALLSLVTADAGWYDSGILKNDIRQFIASLRDEDWDALRGALEDMAGVLLEHLDADVQNETKDALALDILLPAVLASCKEHLGVLSESVDLKQVAEDAVNAMRSEDIEKLFYRFAGGYFTKIILYGWIGAAGGLVSALQRIFH